MGILVMLGVTLILFFGIWLTIQVVEYIDYPHLTNFLLLRWWKKHFEDKTWLGTINQEYKNKYRMSPGFELIGYANPKFSGGYCYDVYVDRQLYDEVLLARLKEMKQ